MSAGISRPFIICRPVRSLVFRTCHHPCLGSAGWLWIETCLALFALTIPKGHSQHLAAGGLFCFPAGARTPSAASIRKMLHLQHSRFLPCAGLPCQMFGISGQVPVLSGLMRATVAHSVPCIGLGCRPRCGRCIAVALRSVCPLPGQVVPHSLPCRRFSAKICYQPLGKVRHASRPCRRADGFCFLASSMYRDKGTSAGCRSGLAHIPDCPDGC